MVLLLRSCVLVRKKLFTQEVVSFKHLVTYPKYSNNLKKFVPSLQVKYFSIDKDDTEKKELIYSGELWPRIRHIKIFSITSSIASTLGQPFIFMKAIDGDNLVSMGIAFAVANLIIMGSPIFIYLLTKRYVIDLYYCPKEKNYTAVVCGFFFKRKEITFTPDDVKLPGTFGGSLTSCFVKKNPLFIDENQFADLKHYNIIMGYNKPSDFEVQPLDITPINRFPVVSQSLQLENRTKKEN